MKKIKPLEVTFILLADAHKGSDQGKLDCFGIFTQIGVWDVPASRACSVAFGLSNLTEGRHTLSMWIKHDLQKAIKLSEVEINAEKDTTIAVFAERLPMPIGSLGIHYVGIAKGSNRSPINATWIPVTIEKLPWPSLLSGDTLTEALKDPQTVKRAQATLMCHKCRKKYIFEVHIDPDAKLSKGSIHFPDDGQFLCRKCNQVHSLKDIEGQLRSQLGRTSAGESR